MGITQMKALYAYPLAALSGLALALSFPAAGWWPLAFVGIVGTLAVSLGRGFLSGLGVGLVTGISFWVALIQWLSLYLGPVPWLALSLVMGAYFGIGVAATAWACRWMLARFRHRGLSWIPFIIACLWLTRETVSGLWPYGGFPWARIALSQSDSPVAAVSSWIGISGLSFVMVLVCAVPCVLVWWRASRTEIEADQDLADGTRRVLAAVATLVAICAVTVPSWGSMAAANAPTIRVAAIQGNAKAGLFAEHARGEWLANHLAATRAADLTGVDVVVWPENSSDIDPAENPDAEAAINRLVNTTGVPLVFGTIQKRGDLYFNSSLVWERGVGISDVYDKRHPVPFAEYMPDRAFFRALAPDLVDMVQRAYTAGTSNGVFTAAGARFGVNICFDVAYDDVIRDAVFGGASFLVSQTNNADFGWSDEGSQQLAIARMQAIANGRSMVSISTVGFSAIFSPSGDVLSTVPRYEAAALIADLPEVSAIAPGTVVNVIVELAAGCFAIGVICVVGYARAARSRRHNGRYVA